MDNAIAYFTLEIGLEETIPTYSGGLGILAADCARAAADLGIPMLVMTLLYRKGYFRQHLDAAGVQTEEAVTWPVADRLTETNARCTVEIEGRRVQLRAWRYDIKGVTGHVVPVYYLDAALDDNAEADRAFTDYLYGGDDRYRLCQEIILGIGGVRMLRALGCRDIKRYHMNEGHAALLTFELAHELAVQAWNLAYAPVKQVVTPELMHLVRGQCVFTTHTPVPAGHDRFGLDLVHRVLTGYRGAFDDSEKDFAPDGMLDMTSIALDNSHFINGVAKRHGTVTREMYSEYKIDSITNGVHATTWAGAPMAQLFDRLIPGWREDNSSLRYALRIPRRDIWVAHAQAKTALVAEVARRTGVALDAKTFTIGFARRAAVYKRAELLFRNPDQLAAIGAKAGAIQIIYAGKAHPHDQGGKDIIRRIFQFRDALKDRVRIVYLEDYGIEIAKLVTAGVDLWLNTPQPPLEASGTSGMKAALNGVPSLSIMDGWWIEGCIEGVTGWAIGKTDGAIEFRDTSADDAQSLYNKLEMIVLPMYYGEPEKFADVMRNAIALNGSFFNTERMVDQYVAKAYFR
jgi:starch phosphorylase